MKKLISKIIRSEFLRGFARGVNNAHVMQFML